MSPRKGMKVNAPHQTAALSTSAEYTDDSRPTEMPERIVVAGPVRAELAAYPLVLTDCVVDGRRRRLRPCGGGPGDAAVELPEREGVEPGEEAVLPGAMSARAVRARAR